MAETFRVYPSTGFFPKAPLERLPDHFKAWEDLIDQLSVLLKSKRLREEIDKLPLIVVSARDLPTEQHWERALKVLTFLSQGYLWQDGEEGAVPALPSQLAIPWWEVSQRLGLPTVATYAAVVLWNWKLKDPKGPITLENIQMDTTYTGTEDEEWFYLISGAIELSAAKGIDHAWKCLEEVKNGNIAKVVENLKAVTACIGKDMMDVLEKMYEKCNPDVFYGRIRQFQAGSKDLKAFKDGLVLEGVKPEPVRFVGASAAQSSTLALFDTLLGVQHKDSMVKTFLDMQRWHMPRSHRQFLLSLSLQPPLRALVLANKSNEDLLQAYNECVETLAEFRNQHIIMVTRYILIPSGRKASTDSTSKKTEEATLATRGTGGSDFMVFLKTSRDETLSCVMKSQ